MARVKDYYWSIIAQEEIEYDEESGEQWIIIAKHNKNI